MVLMLCDAAVTCDGSCNAAQAGQQQEGLGEVGGSQLQGIACRHTCMHPQHSGLQLKAEDPDLCADPPFQAQILAVTAGANCIVHHVQIIPEDREGCISQSHLKAAAHTRISF